MNLTRRDLLRQSLATGLATSLTLADRILLAQEKREQPAETYRSPYSLKFRHSLKSLERGFEQKPWNSPELESDIPHHEWYSEKVRRKYGVWGPPARQYPAPHGIGKEAPEWWQDRLIHTASRWIGTPYQHHHIPDWHPPEGWPWKKVAYGRNSKGIDCSNFSSFYYNYGLGIRLDTGIKQQAERLKVRGPGGRGILEAERVERANYDQLVKTLEPGDLLYIRNNSGTVSHVIMFLGQVGQSPDGTPLVMDSTGGGHTDCNGKRIPIGVHIRPFLPDSWYAKNFSHAHRLIHGISHVQKGTVAESEELGAEEVTEQEMALSR